MLTCDDCGQTYRSRGTLKRHQQNHRDTDQAHFCPVCHVGFKRRDLLVRHARIHRDESLFSRRQRCHTACDNCRTAHVRCNGGRPCPMCVQQDRSCTYQNTTSGRMSEQQPLPQSMEAESIEFDETIDSMAFAGPTVSQDPDMDTFLMSNTFWPFSTSWQWQHEDQYLQGPSSLLGSNEDDVLLPSDHGPLLDLDQRSTRAGDLTHSRPSTHAQSAVESGAPTPPSLRAVIEIIVEGALKSHNPSQWGAHARLVSKFVSNGPSLALQSPRGQATLFDDFVDQYFEHFQPLWAMMPRDRNIHTTSHPLLYLALTSIGALYSGSAGAANYGSLLHKKLREVLVHQSFPQQQSEAEALDIGRAMLLMQVAALYFEQDGAFSAAQRLAATLSSHAHRMRLFTSRKRDWHPSSTANHDPSKEALLVEGRKMLAFGIVRAETFMSVLFNRKPIISYEEVDLQLPLARDITVFTQNHAGGSQPMVLPCGGIYFSDLTRILLEDGEVLPILRPADAEILLFGLQHEIWRFSHDPNVFSRLIKVRHPVTPNQNNKTRVDGEHDHLDYSSRKMNALVGDYRRTIAALGKWKHALSQSQMSHAQDHSTRSACLSGIILHDLSFLRLLAPLDAIQQTAYQLHDPSTSDQEVIDEIYAWALTDPAREAVRYARSIWHTLRQETMRAAGTQARYNILALIALHHGAVVIWAVAGADACPEELLSDASAIQAPGHTSTEITICRSNTRSLMLRFADIYPAITAAWGMQSSFSKMVLRLADYPFPLHSTKL